MKNIVLIGMPGTGKSSVGVILAKHISYAFMDTDIELARRAGRTLPRILREDGLDRFLELEGETGLAVDCENTVIATGGSMVFSENAMQHLCESGVVIWLETPVETLEERLTGGSRERRGVAAPGDMSVRDIYALREPLYTKYADLRIACRAGVENVVADIIRKLQKTGIISELQAE